MGEYLVSDVDLGSLRTTWVVALLIPESSVLTRFKSGLRVIGTCMLLLSGYITGVGLRVPAYVGCVRLCGFQ